VNGCSDGEEKKRAMIPLSENPDDPEVDRGRWFASVAPWSPQAARANDDWHSPAEWLNKHRYHDNLLRNLLVSASLAGFHGKASPLHTPA
jgi:hypothetical protein